MKIDYRSVKYLGQPDPEDTRHQIELPQERGQGSHFEIVYICEDDLPELQGMFGQMISLQGEIEDAKDAPKCILNLVAKEDEPVEMVDSEFSADAEAKLIAEPNPADSEPNPAKTEPDLNPDQ